MQTFFAVLRLLHILAGFMALAVFWLPLVTRKGGRAHAVIGWLYVAAMGAVSITALLMGLYRLTWDAGPDEDAIPYSWFLIFVAVLSSATAWYGLRALRFKRRKTPHRRAVDLLFPSLLVISGLGISGYGWAIGFPLLQAFPLIGLFLGFLQLKYWLRPPSGPSHWIVEHLVGMLSCCIATVTAFLVFGVPRLLGVEATSLLLWLLPTACLVPLMFWFAGKYKTKPARSKPAA
ncbi:hypothetical protein J31TS4_06470 [Paenibacillus sp. J31TS4]|uniref:DUF2306 domain-containing protein n=1 Tax=Paenibacillus sp. J31TS4 TaxID=2807195 RepID=UPI001B1B94DE|nr:DUF2306 domain-containing protein [Paenibacillus sp. J31TS4]GIP37367.1 hypothetical protein J31TS4_06470 [Paenibacillus sp. J31TS4]